MGFWDWLLGRGEPANAPRPTTDRALPAAPPSAPAKVDVAPPPPKPVAVPVFGVEQAIQLMKKLPLDNEPDLVLRVVRKTLQATGVSLDEIIRAARSRERGLDEEIARERSAIEKLEAEIATKKATIDRAIEQTKETRAMRGRLEEAVSHESRVGILAAPAEIERMKAEAEAKAKAKEKEKAAAEAKDAEPAPKPPPAPKSAAPPAPKMSSPPKPPPPLPSTRSTAPKPDIPSVAPREEEEETAKNELGIPKDALPKDAEKS